MSSKSVLIAGSKEVDKRIFAITCAEFLASLNYSCLIITKSFDFLPEPLHGRFRESEDYSQISLRYPQNVQGLASILLDFTLFRKLSKGPFTIIVENIDEFCANSTEEISRLVAAVLGATPYIENQVYPKLIVTLNTTGNVALAPLSCLFDSIWEAEKNNKEVSLSMTGKGKVCFEELELSAGCPQLALRLKSILLTAQLQITSITEKSKATH